jgi:hypothetical protein
MGFSISCGRGVVRMDWLNQHLPHNSIIPLFSLPDIWELIAAQQGRALSDAFPSGEYKARQGPALSTPGMGTVGSRSFQAQESSPKPVSSAEMPPLAPEPHAPPIRQPKPGERKPEKDPVRSLDRPERPSAPARYSPALPSSKYLAAIHSKPSLPVICGSSGMTCSGSRFPPLPP